MHPQSGRGYYGQNRAYYIHIFMVYKNFRVIQMFSEQHIIDVAITISDTVTDKLTKVV